MALTHSAPLIIPQQKRDCILLISAAYSPAYFIAMLFYILPAS